VNFLSRQSVLSFFIRCCLHSHTCDISSKFITSTQPSLTPSVSVEASVIPTLSREPSGAPSKASTPNLRGLQLRRQLLRQAPRPRLHLLRPPRVLILRNPQRESPRNQRAVHLLKVITLKIHRVDPRLHLQRPPRLFLPFRNGALS
jgi:hypothetical protein